MLSFSKNIDHRIEIQDQGWTAIFTGMVAGRHTYAGLPRLPVDQMLASSSTTGSLHYLLLNQI